MLNNQTRGIIKELTNIGNSAIFEYPVSSISMPEKTVTAFIHLDKLGEEKFEPFGIFYLKEFIALLDFYKGAEIKNENGVIDIRTSNAHQKYETESLVKMENFKVPYTVVEKINNSPEVVNFNLSKDMLQQIKKIASILNLQKLIIDTENEQLIVTNIDANENYINPAEFVIGMNKSENAKIYLDLNNILLIPDWDYSVKVAKNSQTGNTITLWEAIDNPVELVIVTSF